MKKMILLFISFIGPIHYSYGMDSQGSPPSAQNAQIAAKLLCFICKKTVLPQIKIPLCDIHTAHLHQLCLLTNIEKMQPYIEKTKECPICLSPDKSDSTTEKTT